MSESCGNPRCIVHGDSPEAKERRQALQEIKTNEELMSVIRVLAANAHNAIQDRGAEHGYPANPLLDFALNRILSGHMDSDPIVQGIVEGLAVLLRSSHEPTKVFITDCSKIQAPHVADRIAAADAEREKERGKSPPEFGFMEIPFEELMAFLLKNSR